MYEKFFKTIDGLKAPTEAVKKTIKAARLAEQSGKVIEMKKSYKKFNFKRVSAIAACLAATIACTAILGSFDEKNYFTITAGAVETATGEATPDEKNIVTNNFTTIGTFKYSGGSASGETSPYEGDERYVNIEEGTIELSAKFSVKGNNIKEINYSVDSGGVIGLFSNDKLISHSKTTLSSFHNDQIADGKGNPITYYYDVASNYESQLDNLTLKYYKEFTEQDQNIVCNYWNHQCKKQWIEMTTSDMGSYWEEPFWKDSTDEKTVKRLASYVTDYVNLMLKDNSVKVTVTYNDGTKETKNIIMKAKCVPRVANYKEWGDKSQYIDKYGDKDVYMFDEIEISTKAEE